MALLFAALAAGLALIAAAAWRGGQPVIAIGALAVAVWLALLAHGAVRRRG